MSPSLSDSLIAVGSSIASRVYLGGFAVWNPTSSIELPSIGDPFEGGHYVGLVDYNQAGVGTHALVAAPRTGGASGMDYPVSTRYFYRTTNTALSGASSLFDGAANTQAMVQTGIALFPAANFCVSLSIGGYNDWYLPAYAEMEVAYFNLKPSTFSNNTSAGSNLYAVPPRASNYTASVPPQTSLVSWQGFGADAFAGRVHWSSTTAHGFVARRLDYAAGGVDNISYMTNSNVRAFRKVAL